LTKGRYQGILTTCVILENQVIYNTELEEQGEGYSKLTSKQRSLFLSDKLGKAESIVFETSLYQLMESLCPEFSGGKWDIYKVGEDSFFMAPVSKNNFTMYSPNQFQATISAISAGMAVTMFVFSSRMYFEPDHQGYEKAYADLLSFIEKSFEGPKILRLID